jgi:hypothetical protein
MPPSVRPPVAPVALAEGSFKWDKIRIFLLEFLSQNARRHRRQLRQELARNALLLRFRHQPKEESP